MSGSETLERRYRRLLALYPRSFRAEREEEMLAVLMAGADEDRRRPRPAEVVDLVAHAAPIRLRQGPPPGSLARRHPRAILAARILVSLWLVFLTVVLCRYTPWALLLLVLVALHACFAARAVVFMRDGRRGPPSRS